MDLDGIVVNDLDERVFASHLESSDLLGSVYQKTKGKAVLSHDVLRILIPSGSEPDPVALHLKGHVVCLDSGTGIRWPAVGPVRQRRGGKIGYRRPEASIAAFSMLRIRVCSIVCSLVIYVGRVVYASGVKPDMSGPTWTAGPMLRYPGRLLAFAQSNHELVTLCLRGDTLLIVG